MKSTSEKVKEVFEIYSNLKSLGISEDVCESIKTFKKIANDFIKSDTSISGKIKLFEINRVLVYLLSQQDNIKSYAVLKYNEFD